MQLSAYVDAWLASYLGNGAVSSFTYAQTIYVLPISLVIASLLAIVAFSYRQTIYAYPKGGGAYIVAKENIGPNAGLVAAASLLAGAARRETPP